MKVCQCVRDFLVMAVDLANSVFWPDLQNPALCLTLIFHSAPVVDRRVLMNSTDMKIRDAVMEDAAAACEVMRRSITELCIADHKNDPTILHAWLSNKTPEIFRSWMRSDNSLLVAVEGNHLLAVGSVTSDGTITLNYVSPDARFRGISTALLSALEQRAMERGNQLCTLESTRTAQRFYLARGYSEIGPAAANFGTASGYPMSKRLVRNS
jgi:GNAT superfamily N-acetyltransferase